MFRGCFLRLLLRWICGRTRMDRVRNDDIRDRLEVTPIEEKLIQHRLRWFGHVQRRPPEAPVHCGVQSQANNMRRVRGRPKTAYKGFFVGSISFEPCERIWKTWAPPKCRFFVWLVAHNRCWTADRLARRGLPHPEHCPLCDQAAETIDHLLV